MTNITVFCRVCGYTARRSLMPTPGCHGAGECGVEPGRCPRGHGALERENDPTRGGALR